MLKVLYSPGYGAGWSTFNDHRIANFMMTYQPIIEFLEAGNTLTKDHPLVLKMVETIKNNWHIDHICTAGVSQLKVAEVNSRPIINQHDGNETINEYK